MRLAKPVVDGIMHSLKALLGIEAAAIQGYVRSVGSHQDLSIKGTS